MARRKKDRVNVAWHLGAHLSGALVIALPYISETRVMRALQLLAFLYCMLCSLDAVLTKYQLWHFEPMAPQDKHFVLLTGASSGIGREMAYLLAERKYSLVLAARSEAVLERMRGEIEMVHKVQVLVCACDLATDAGVAKLIAFVRDKDLTIDILINNAGASMTGNFHELSADQVDQLLKLNVMATVKLTHAIVPQLVARRRGQILNMGSLASAAPNPFAALYGSSKAFVVNFTQAINYELRSTGVTATCFCPGPVETNFHKTAACDSALYIKVPGVTMHPKDCAQAALTAMFNAVEIEYDSTITRFLAMMLRSVVPTRFVLMLAAVSMHHPRKALDMIRR
ncbi:TPA: hypothetical protein N0F65_010468 [Lagenidium giganteum]|uniref:Uncharacterized protein n=1 Tax=Lagenidium giganteum TaxID=4803 RepID=A0AAV2YHM3_9STRA|nr:TPA: hypothetical protein N0F65_010468 [Lagenidium giganteum]